MLGDRRLFAIKPVPQFAYANRPVAQRVENSDPQRVGENLEELGFEIVAHIRIFDHSQGGPRGEARDQCQRDAEPAGAEQHSTRDIGEVMSSES